jgi:predicted tellurium resistance membrane protein TerC
MFDSAYRKTILILGLTLALVLSLIALVVQEEVREKLGPLFYVLGFAIIGCVLLVLAGYVWNQALMKGLKSLQDTARQTASEPESSDDSEQDEIIGLARKIEPMPRNLKKSRLVTAGSSRIRLTSFAAIGSTGSSPSSMAPMPAP